MRLLPPFLSPSNGTTTLEEGDPFPSYPGVDRQSCSLLGPTALVRGFRFGTKAFLENATLDSASPHGLARYLVAAV